MTIAWINTAKSSTRTNGGHIWRCRFTQPDPSLVEFARSIGSNCSAIMMKNLMRHVLTLGELEIEWRTGGRGTIEHPRKEILRNGPFINSDIDRGWDETTTVDTQATVRGICFHRIKLHESQCRWNGANTDFIFFFFSKVARNDNQVMGEKWHHRFFIYIQKKKQGKMVLDWHSTDSCTAHIHHTGWLPWNQPQCGCNSPPSVSEHHI